MFAAILVIMVLPVTDLGRSKGLQFRPLSRNIFWLFGITLLGLIKIGAEHAEPPFITVGQILTSIYFLTLSLLMLIISTAGNTLSDIAALKFREEALSHEKEITLDYLSGGKLSNTSSVNKVQKS
jgi:ubiquinol-cytochrome c reductase cytochrome b subunit